MAKSGFTANTKDFRRQCQAFAKFNGVHAREVLRMAAGQYAAVLAKNPIPHGKAEGGTVKQKIRHAIDRDLRRAFRVLLPKSGPVYGRKNKPDLAAHHKVTRDPQTGRVSKRYGRDSSLYRPVIAEGEMKRYAAQAAKRIGALQAGWKPAALKFGGKLPAYVARQKGRGGYRDRSTKKGGGTIYLINRVPYASRFYHRRNLKWAAARVYGLFRRLLIMEQSKAVDFFNRMRARAA